MRPSPLLPRLLVAVALGGCSQPLPEKEVPEDSGIADNSGTSDTTPTDSAATDSTPPDTTTTTQDSPADSVDSPAPVDSDTAPVDTGEALPLTATDCFGSIWGGAPPVDYDQFGPVVGSHCYGTNHQDIVGVQHVVFVGDSITVGSPPTAVEDWYRNQLADSLATHFGLDAPAWDWENVNIIDGVVLTQDSGDFSSCAKWGARTDDLLQEPHLQLETCIPEDRRDETTLIVMTIGGNDIYSLLEDVNAGVDEATLRTTFSDAMALMREAAEWAADPVKFPNGVYVVFANIYDFSDFDGAEDMALCPGAQLIGMSPALEDPLLEEIIGDAQEEFMSIAVDTQTDMVFLGENFCGHGYNGDDPAGRCYRGAGAELWLDFTCMHPSDIGHTALADMFMAVVEE